jgi:uncharacterized protein
MPARDHYKQGEFCWVDLNAHDMEGARQFYSKVFGWDAVMFDTQGGPPYAGWMLAGKNVAGMGQMSDEMKAQGIPPSWNCYICFDDAAAAEKRAKELGAHVVFPTMQAVDAGKMAFIADPTGAIFATWQPITHHGSQLWGDDNTPCWCELATKDVEAARAFYEKLCGWTCNEFPGVPSKYYVANVNRTEMTGGLMQMTAEWGDMPSHWSVYFHVADVDATCNKVTANGGKVVVPAFDAGVGRIAGCTDAQGAFFYLIKMAQPG